MGRIDLSPSRPPFPSPTGTGEGVEAGVGAISARWLGLVVAAYLLIGLQYAALTPAWQVPDEPAHYNYVRHVAQSGRIPVLAVEDYDQAYLSRLTAEGFPSHLPIDSLRYEAWQPPLYYLLAAPVFLLSDGALLPLRAFSLALGAGVIVFAFLAVRELLPGRPLAAVTAAGFIAFIPQHVAMMAGVNNDSLAELLIAVGLWRILRVNARGLLARDVASISAIMAAAFVTKSQAYVLAPVAGVMLLLLWRRQGWGQWRQLARRGLAMFLPALLVGALWWGRNLAVYGWPDFMAAIRHDQVVAGQPRTQQWLEAYGTAEVARRLAQTTFQSFWGQFGWMGVVLDSRVYAALLLYSGALAAGLAIAAARGPHPEPVQRDGWILLVVSGLLTVAVYLAYNTSYVQHQGRYLFPALIPIGAGAAVSLWTWGRLAERAMKRELGWALPAAVLLGMAALDVAVLYRFILPAL